MPLRGGQTFNWGNALRALALVGQLGFTVVGGALVGYGLGYGISLLGGGKIARLSGLIFGLAGGIWSALRLIKRVVEKKRGD